MVPLRAYVVALASMLAGGAFSGTIIRVFFQRPSPSRNRSEVPSGGGRRRRGAQFVLTGP